MPPTRRRPVPTPPAGGRPKVAGLTRRSTAPAPEPEVSEPEVAEVAEVPEAEVAEPVVAVEEVAGEDVAVEEKAPEPNLWAPPPQAPESGSPTWILPVVLVVVALLLGGAGFSFQQQAGKASYDAALVDSAQTAEVNGQVREGVEKAFSYNFADVTATENAANELLTGKAKCQYNAVFGPVRTLAPEQKLVVTVKVVASAVSSLKNDHATVLVFVDQVTTRTTDNQTGGGTAMLRAGARKADGRWKIDNMEMFGQTPEQAQQMAQCQG